MRKALVLPSWGMIGAFILGIAIILIWGVGAGVTGSNVFAEFFSSFAILLQYPAVAIIMVFLLLISLIKLFYYAISFFMGILVGLLILMVVGSSFTSGLLSGSIVNVKGNIRSFYHGVFPLTNSRDVVN